jgi:hypothetical protein
MLYLKIQTTPAERPVQLKDKLRRKTGQYSTVEDEERIDLAFTRHSMERAHD